MLFRPITFRLNSAYLRPSKETSWHDIHPGTPITQAWIVISGLFIASGSFAADVAFTSRAASTVSTVEIKSKLPSPTGTIHWGVKRDGSVVLSDRPVAGSTLVKSGVETYQTASDAESIARSKAELKYWRDQSLAFEKRQEKRDQELEQRQQLAAMSRVEAVAYSSPPIYYAPRYGVGGRYGQRYGQGYGYSPYPQSSANTQLPLGNGQMSIGGGAPTLNSPQAAALGGGASPFLSSGFAQNLAR